MLHIKLTKPTEFGNLVMNIRVPRNPVVHYLTQACMEVKYYTDRGWNIAFARIE
jgi:hypothetical protein